MHRDPARREYGEAMAEDSPAQPDPRSESATPTTDPAAAKLHSEQVAPESAIADTVADSIGEAIAGSSLPLLIPVQPDTGYTPAGVPTLEGVREKIETRYATALGATELAEGTPAGRDVVERFEERQKAAADKLDQIRATMDQEERTAD